MNIYQKLQICRVALQNTDLKKSGENKFAGFKYFELADFLPTVNKLFNESGLFSKFDIKDNTAYLTIINAEKPEEKETFESPIAESSVKGCTPIQCLGGVHTYMKRYLYVNALEITDGDIFDAVVGKPEKTEPKKVSVSEELLKECQELKIDLVNVAKYYKKTVEELTDEEVKVCIERKKAVRK